MDYEAYANRIIELKAKDDALRDRLIKEGSLNDGYHPEMRTLHNENIQAFKVMWEKFGFPNISRVGEKAYEAAFIIVQHAIDHPPILRSFAEALLEAASHKEAQMIHYAYLIDRIAVYEGQPQVYGTQFDWDESGQMSPIGEIDVKAINLKRTELGLIRMDEQIQRMRVNVKKTGQRPPNDWFKKNQEYLAWLREIGWRD